MKFRLWVGAAVLTIGAIAGGLALAQIDTSKNPYAEQMRATGKPPYMAQNIRVNLDLPEGFAEQPLQPDRAVDGTGRMTQFFAGPSEKRIALTIDPVRSEPRIDGADFHRSVQIDPTTTGTLYQMSKGGGTNLILTWEKTGKNGTFSTLTLSGFKATEQELLAMARSARYEIPK